jgi:isoleucyl-tRNA synthetase
LASPRQRPGLSGYLDHHPWTLPANRAISCPGEFDYALVQVDGQALILAKDLVESVLKRAHITDYTVLGTVRRRAGADALQTSVPGLRRSGDPGRPRDAGCGTGAVHTAGGHGPDDYNISLKYGLEIANPVGPDGSCRHLPALDGINVFKANDHR